MPAYLSPAMRHKRIPMFWLGLDRAVRCFVPITVMSPRLPDDSPTNL